MNCVESLRGDDRMDPNIQKIYISVRTLPRTKKNPSNRGPMGRNCDDDWGCM